MLLVPLEEKLAFSTYEPQHYLFYRKAYDGLLSDLCNRISGEREGLLRLHSCERRMVHGKFNHVFQNSSARYLSRSLVPCRDGLPTDTPVIAEDKGLTQSELYKALGTLTKDKGRWKESIPYVSSLLAHESVKIQAKALWLLGEMGLAYPLSVQPAVPAIASFLDSPVPLLRERAVNTLGRIGRGDYSVVEPYWTCLFRFASDEEPKVRLSFIWASENIAANTPDIYERHMPLFEALLHDADDMVRMEAPEMFRVLGKRRPEFVRPYLELLRRISEADENPVVRIHCLGAIKATMSGRTTRTLSDRAERRHYDL